MDNDERFGNDPNAVAEWEDFIASHVRYVDTEANWQKLFGFLKRFELEFTNDHLHRAFLALRDELELLEPLPAIVGEQSPTAAPEAQPTPQPQADPRAAQMFRNGRPMDWVNARPI